MWYHVGASILGGELALKEKWAITLSGGMHHASHNKGGGWCVYADISISIKNLIDKKLVQKVMVIDLDAHQGNGIENDKKNKIIMKNTENLFIIDVYNGEKYPFDLFAEKAIDINKKINPFKIREKCAEAVFKELEKKTLSKEKQQKLLQSTYDEEYMNIVRSAVEEGFDKFKPDIVYYNAGTDILTGDRLGGFDVSEDGIIERDEYVFDFCMKKYNVPIVMVLSGGYAPNNYKVIGKSIENLIKKFDLIEK
jgi:histone deacetylase 11